MPVSHSDPSIDWACVFVTPAARDGNTCFVARLMQCVESPSRRGLVCFLSALPKLDRGRMPLPTTINAASESPLDLHTLHGYGANWVQGLPTSAERDALVIMDRGTRYIECDPLRSKMSRDGQRAILNYLGPRDEVRLMDTDAAQELIQIMGGLQIGSRRRIGLRPPAWRNVQCVPS